MRVAKTKTGPTAQVHKIEHSLGKKFNSSPESSRTHWLQVFSLCLGYVTVLVRRALALINRAQAPVTPSSLVSFLSSTRCDYCLRTSQRVGLWSLWPSLFFFILKSPCAERFTHLTLKSHQETAGRLVPALSSASARSHGKHIGSGVRSASSGILRNPPSHIMTLWSDQLCDFG